MHHPGQFFDLKTALVQDECRVENVFRPQA